MPFTWQVSLSLKRSTTSVAAKAAKNWFQKDFVCKRRGNATLLSESSLIFFNPHECPSGCVCDRDAILFTCSASFRTLQLILQLCQWVEEPPGHCAFKILGPRLVWIARLITEVVCSFLKSCLIRTFFFFFPEEQADDLLCIFRPHDFSLGADWLEEWQLLMGHPMAWGPL